MAADPLIDWQDARGFGLSAARRLADVHVSLGVGGPTSLHWEQDSLPEELTYVYEQSVG